MSPRRIFKYGFQLNDVVAIALPVGAQVLDDSHAWELDFASRSWGAA